MKKRAFLRVFEHAGRAFSLACQGFSHQWRSNMTEDLSSRPEAKPTQEHLSLIDLLCVRMAYERTTREMCDAFIDKARQSKDAVVRALDLSRLQAFGETLTEHLHLLTQSLDVLGDKVDTDHLEPRHQHFLILAKAAQTQVSDPEVAVLPSMQALLAVEQFNEVAWGLLLALVKDAELQRFVGHFEQACARHRDQRISLQQGYEDVALGLVRRHQLAVKSTRPLKSTIAGRAGMLFGDPRHLGRI
jgi:hypothetical protein